MVKKEKANVKVVANSKCKKKTTKQKFTETMTIAEVLRIAPDAAGILLGFGMHCFGCPLSAMETLKEAAVAHGADLKLMMKKLNEL